MVQLSPLPALPPVAVPRGVAFASGGATGFATVLGAVQAAATPVSGPVPVPGIAAPFASPAGQPGNARQEIAVPGNVLPERPASDAQAEGEDVDSDLSTDADTEADGASAPLDPAIAWLAPLFVPDAPDAPPIAPGLASPSPNVVPLDFRQAATSGGVAVAPELADATPRADGDAPDAPRTPDAAAAPDGFRPPAGMIATRPTPLARPDAAPAPVAGPALADALAEPARTTEVPGKAQLPARPDTSSVEPADAPGRAVDTRTAPAIVPPAATPTAPVVAPPITAAAAAAPLAAATADPVTRAPARRDPVDSASPTGVAAAALAGQATSPLAVAATASAQQGALDMTDSGWMESMIDRIETMRDESGARDTRIRLAPNALGTVELAIRHEGDRIHVHFAADNAQARQMLSDAQPQLAEIAHERGLKLGQSSVDAGTANGGQQRDPAPESLSRRPVAAPAEASDASAPDTRIA